MRFAYYVDDLVLLDLLRNRFHIVRDVPAESVRALFRPRDDAATARLRNTLRALGALAEIPFHGVLGAEHGTRAGAGSLEQRWLPPLDSPCALTFRDRCKAFLALRRAARLIAKDGFKRIARLTRPGASGPPAPREAGVLARALASLNSVFPLDRSGNQCLTYSVALLLLLRPHIPDARLVVGVKTRPFLSHAWVECHGRVVSDAPDLRNKLSVILEV